MVFKNIDQPRSVLRGFFSLVKIETPTKRCEKIEAARRNIPAQKKSDFETCETGR